MSERLVVNILRMCGSRYKLEMIGMIELLVNGFWEKWVFMGIYGGIVVE